MPLQNLLLISRYSVNTNEILPTLIQKIEKKIQRDCKNCLMHANKLAMIYELIDNFRKKK